MPATFDRCPACKSATSVRLEERTAVLKVLNACKTCRLWHCTLLLAAIVAFMLSNLAAIYSYCQGRGIQPSMSPIGISLTIVGGFLVFGKLEILLLMGSTLGSYHVEENMAVVARETQRARIGLLLVIVGLLFQAWS